MHVHAHVYVSASVSLSLSLSLYVRVMHMHMHVCGDVWRAHAIAYKMHTRIYERSRIVDAYASSRFPH